MSLHSVLYILNTWKVQWIPAWGQFLKKFSSDLNLKVIRESISVSDLKIFPETGPKDINGLQFTSADKI